MAVILTLMALLVPALSSINAGNNLTKAAYDTASTLDQARAYAMSNRTYVFVGFEEVDESVSASTSPQITTSTMPYGRVAVAVVASRDGTKHYADFTTTQGSDWQADYADSSKPAYQGEHLMAISKLQRFENLHLASSHSPPASGPMVRPPVPTTYVIGNSACKSQTPFTWPLGSPLASGYQYRFDKVVQFDPQGVARITYRTNQDKIVQWMEAGLQQRHGAEFRGYPGGCHGRLDPSLLPMMTERRQVRAFSLVEVTIAMVVATFCLIAIFGLLPVGLNSNLASIQQTAAASLANRLSADLRAVKTTTPPSAQISPLYQIPLPKPGDTTSTYTLYLADDGTLANAAGGDADLTKNPCYRATLFITAPATSQKTATTVRMLFTWPAVADKTAGTLPKNFAGSFEAITALDRN